MGNTVSRSRFAIGALVLALLVVPVAIASGGGSDGAQATASGGVGKKVKKLTKRVDQLEQQLAGLQGEQGGARPPTGPAGGDLAGTYPNPLIGPNAIGSNEVEADSLTDEDLATNSVSADEIAQNAVQSDEIQTSAVNADEIGDGLLLDFGTTVTVNGGTEGNGAANINASGTACGIGQQIVTAFGEWTDNSTPSNADQTPGDEELYTVEVSVNPGTDSATAVGANDTDNDHHFRVVALCLEA